MAYPYIVEGLFRINSATYRCHWLPFTARTRSQTTTMIEFLVVKAHLSYNTIIGHPTLNKMIAITSTYYLQMKLSPYACVREVRGKKVLARKCYKQELYSGGS